MVPPRRREEIAASRDEAAIRRLDQVVDMQLAIEKHARLQDEQAILEALRAGETLEWRFRIEIYPDALGEYEQ